MVAHCDNTRFPGLKDGPTYSTFFKLRTLVVDIISLYQIPGGVEGDAGSGLDRDRFGTNMDYTSALSGVLEYGITCRHGIGAG